MSFKQIQRTASTEDFLILREFLKEIQYSSIFDFLKGSENSLFPSYSVMDRKIGLLSKELRFYFSILFLGRSTDAMFCHAYFPENVFSALINCGFLMKNKKEEYDTDGNSLVSHFGIIFITTLPYHYENRPYKYNLEVLDENELMLINSLNTTNLKNKSLLDYNSRTGILAIIGNKLGTNKTYILPYDGNEEIVDFNMKLNQINYCVYDDKDSFDILVSYVNNLPRLEEYSSSNLKNSTDFTRNINSNLLSKILEAGFILKYSIGCENNSFDTDNFSFEGKKAALQLNFLILDKMSILTYIESMISSNFRAWTKLVGYSNKKSIEYIEAFKPYLNLKEKDKGKEQNRYIHKEYITLKKSNNIVINRNLVQDESIYDPMLSQVLVSHLLN